MTYGSGYSWGAVLGLWGFKPVFSKGFAKRFLHCSLKWFSTMVFKGETIGNKVQGAWLESRLRLQNLVELKLIFGNVRNTEETLSISLENGTHKVKPSGQREDKSVQTSYLSLTKARIIKVSRNSAALVSSTCCPSRKHSHVNPPAKEMPNLSNGGGRLLQEDGAEETFPKNDVYAALWVMLDAELENEAEEILGQWDLDGILNNWGKIELDVGPAGNDQGPPPAAN
ncbi:hypothetical protein PIB30_088420 [Stylosanthes scabra]|uniref:Uncharacterized protein n=1 Tax=Stylosanthes scabra TaxID=79078 RepID=A0ABU6SUA4_9FABA|nr:hypothetical protein [Stylosanthes scabra]